MIKHNLFTFDGGGIRGLIPAVLVTAIEKELDASLISLLREPTANGELTESHDYLAGTSTGSIVACAIAAGFTGQEIQSLMTENANEIFPSISPRLWSRLKRSIWGLQGASAPKYDGEGLGAVLQGIFSKPNSDIPMKFGELKVRTLVTSYDAFSRRPVIFKSWKKAHADLNLWEVIKASCSAPTYFPAHIMSVDGVERPLIDGGMVVNNPAACLLSSVLKETGNSAKTGLDTHSIALASFGTGEVTRPITAKEALEWGVFEWAMPIIDVMFDGSSDATHYCCKQLLGVDNYYRFQMPLTDAHDDIDNTDKANLNALKAIAINYLQDNAYAGQNVDSIVFNLSSDA
jgi:patatin-like phospholipase/acyl hydrolase